MEMLIVVTLLCLAHLGNGQIASDKTLQPHARGEDVVDATIDKIRSSCILVDDKYMMKRIAAVETDYGQNSSPNTGGIWKVTLPFIGLVKANCNSRLRTICNDILQTFAYDITTATLSQMDIPLYSGLMMHLYLTNLATIGRRTIPASKTQQASYWKNTIRPNGNPGEYITKSSIKIGCSAVKMELVFAIDASGSVGRYNFAKTLTFLENVVQDLQIAPDMTRVSVIRYASSSTINFNLDTHQSKSDVISGIRAISYTGGGTGTAQAIDLARTSVFNNARLNVPKVFVLITDGYSNSRSSTIRAASDLKNDTTVVFTIGVGNINPYEMHAVASHPSCTHFFKMSSYTEIDAIIQEIQREACIAPTVISPIANALTQNSSTDTPVIADNPIPSDNSTKIQNVNIPPIQTTSPSAQTSNATKTNTTTIKVEVICGTVEMYGHHSQTPSSSIYTYKALATDGLPGWIRSPADTKLYLSLLSQRRLDLTITACTKPHYNISINPPEEKGLEIICRENGEERPCTSDDIKVSFGPLCDDEDNVPNPCTKANILANMMRFEHPKSTAKYIQCKPTGKMEIVKCPKQTQYDKTQKVCNPQITSLPPNSSPYTGVPNPCTQTAIMNKQFYHVNPTDKSSFIQCDEWGKAFNVKCQNNTVWSQHAYTCVHKPTSASLTTNPCKTRPQNHTLYYANPGNRKSFIQCDLSGNAYTMPCPLGTVWLQSKLTCVHDTIQLGLIMSPHQQYTTASRNRITTAPAPAPARCTFGAFLPHSDPRKYNVCGWNGQLTAMSCPVGLVWYQALKVCNWPSGSATG